MGLWNPDDINLPRKQPHAGTCTNSQPERRIANLFPCRVRRVLVDDVVARLMLPFDNSSVLLQFQTLGRRHLCALPLGKEEIARKIPNPSRRSNSVSQSTADYGTPKGVRVCVLRGSLCHCRPWWDSAEFPGFVRYWSCHKRMNHGDLSVHYTDTKPRPQFMDRESAEPSVLLEPQR